MRPRALLVPGVFVLFAVGIQSVSAAEPLCGYRFLRVEPAEQVALLAGPTDSVRLVRAGESLQVGGKGAPGVDEACQALRIIRFEEDLALLEGEGEWGPRTLFVRIEDSKQSVAFMERRPLLKTQLLSAGERRLQQ